jgi:hypothetical protein
LYVVPVASPALTFGERSRAALQVRPCAREKRLNPRAQMTVAQRRQRSPPHLNSVMKPLQFARDLRRQTN